MYILESGEKQQVKILLQNGGVADTDNLPEESDYHDIELLGPLAQPGNHDNLVGMVFDFCQHSFVYVVFSLHTMYVIDVFVVCMLLL